MGLPAHDDKALARLAFERLWRRELEEGIKFAPFSPTWLRAILEGCGFREDMRVLEVGSGSGILSYELARRGARATLLDISGLAIKISSRLFGANGSSGAFVVADAGAMPFADNTFDAVFSSGLLEHFEKSEASQFMEEKARVLKTGGRIVALAPSARGVIYRVGKRWMEREGCWQWGKEKPLWSYRRITPRGVKMLKEYQLDIFSQVAFMPPRYRKKLDSLLRFFARDELDSPFLAKITGGYLLAGVFEKT